MAEVKSTGLVTAEVLKQALSAQVVLNVLEAQVRQIISKQIDDEVKVALASLTESASGAADVAETQDRAAGTDNPATTAQVGATSGAETAPEPAAGTDTSGTVAQDGITNTPGSEAADKPQDNGGAESEGMAEAQSLQ